MKKSAVPAYLILFLAFFLPALLPGRAPAAPEPSQETVSAAVPAALPPLPEIEPAAAEEPVRLLVDGEIREIAMEDYLVGVLAGEMPASFEMEALKAQAVAARTYTLYCAAGHKHGEAQICADPSHCQAWQDEETMRNKWGENWEVYADRLREAVRSTAGQILRYEGELIFAAFHASSAGATEDSGQVWNPRPYLVSVSSPESIETVPNYVTELHCAALDFRDALLSLHPECDFTGEPESWLGPVERDGSGRVASMRLGGTAFRGPELRKLFALRSTAFSLEYREGLFCFTVTGSGHGVGMSQYGANVMARDGADYAHILAHYYPGTQLTTVKQ